MLYRAGIVEAMPVQANEQYSCFPLSWLNGSSKEQKREEDWDLMVFHWTARRIKLSQLNKPCEVSTAEYGNKKAEVRMKKNRQTDTTRIAEDMQSVKMGENMGA